MWKEVQRHLEVGEALGAGLVSLLEDEQCWDMRDKGGKETPELCFP